MERNHFSNDHELFNYLKEKLNQKYEKICISNINRKSKWLNTPGMRNGWEFIIDVLEELKVLDSRNTIACARALAICYLMCYYFEGRSYVEGYYNIILELITNKMMINCWKLGFSNEILPEEFEKILTTPYESAHFHLSRDYDAVRMAATSGNVGLLEMLLKFGAVLLKPHDDVHEWVHTKHILMRLYSGDITSDDLGQQYEDDRFLSKFHPSSRQRLFLIMRGLEIFSKILSQPHQSDMYIASQILLFQSIPEPLITSTEIRKIFEKLLQGIVPNDKILAVCKQYEEYFPESQKPSEPRSLKHLCRCQVRENLRIAKCLTAGVNFLHLPPEIKRYILLKDCRYFERNPILSIMNQSHLPSISYDADNVLFYIPEDF